jgi:signal transduction histidine kinase
MRGHLEVARRGGLSDPVGTGETIDLVLDELEHTTALVDRMLVLGRSMDPDFLHPEPVDLRSFLGDLFTAAQSLAPRQWELGPVPDVVIVLDRDKLRGALLNLIDNAVQAEQRGSGLGLAIVKAVTEAHGGQVVVVSAPGEGCAVRMVFPASRILVRDGRTEANQR